MCIDGNRSPTFMLFLCLKVVVPRRSKLTEATRKVKKRRYLRKNVKLQRLKFRTRIAKGRQSHAFVFAAQSTTA